MLVAFILDYDDAIMSKDNIQNPPSLSSEDYHDRIILVHVSSHLALTSIRISALIKNNKETHNNVIAEIKVSMGKVEIILL